MIKELNFHINSSTPEKLGESFWVPHFCEYLSVRVQVDPQLAMITYIVLLDPEKHIRMMKLLGHGEHTMVIGPDCTKTSLGCVAGEIKAGEWELRLYLYTEYLTRLTPEVISDIDIYVTDEKEDIKETVGEIDWALNPADDSSKGQTASGRGICWYKGDFHTHTHLSDGKETVCRAMEKAKMMDMDFYVPTEHNVLHTGWQKTELLIIPGVEITTEQGHMNLFGVDGMPRHLLDILENMRTDQAQSLVLDTIEEARERGWIVSINHPFLHVWKWRHMDICLKDIHCLEIINDPTYTYAKEANDKAITFLDQLWGDGYKIYGIGGSDSHNRIDERYESADGPSIAGDPGTYVYSSRLTRDGILNNLQKGHVYVSRFCTLTIEIQGESQRYLPGDEVVESGFIAYHMEIQGLEEMPEVYRVYNGRKIRLDCVKKCSDRYVADDIMEWGHESWEWLRMEVRRSNGDFLAYVNPIYAGQKAHRYVTFGNAMNGYNERRKL